MAFEDRFSPSAATSPSGCDVSQKHPDSPESSRTSPYTCQIVQDPDTTSNKSAPIFRITMYALSKPEQSTSSAASSSASDNEDSSLKYSIQKILQPDFGKNAVLRTKSISFKPYDTATSPPPTTPAPLGSLCQTVSQIGSSTVKKPEKSPVNFEQKKENEEITAENNNNNSKVPTIWPAWVYCTRYSDRPSSGPRSRRMKKPPGIKNTNDEKRPRTAFSGAQLARLKHEFTENRYLTERRRQQLSAELGLNEAQIKIWFQNKRAKIKKSSGQKNALAIQLMAQGLYNHSTVACDEDDIPIEPNSMDSS